MRTASACENFGPPYVLRQVVVIGKQVVTTSHRHLHYPRQVAVLDAGGRVQREYWYAGHLNALAAGKYRGREVAFLGGCE